MSLGLVVSFVRVRLCHALIAVAVFSATAADVARAQPAHATLTFPTDHAADVPVPLTFEWSAAAGAQAYYLYVGTALGARNLVDTGEIHGTTYTVSHLPRGETIYVRLWTKRSDGWWVAVDSTFTAAVPNDAIFVAPAADAVVATTTTFSWTAGQQVDAYQLIIGTAPGGSDAFDSGDIQSTSVSAANLPAGRTLYARLFTKHPDGAGTSDLTFATAAPRAAILTRPVDGAENVDLSAPFAWTAVTGAQAYYLYVGTSRGARDLVDTGEIPATTYTVSDLPREQTLYARIWTKREEGWIFSDAAFSVAPQNDAVFVSPAPGSVVPAAATFSWTAGRQVVAYRLTVGTTVGASDVVDSGDIQ